MLPYRDLGCYKNKRSRAISGKVEIWWNNVIDRCYKRARGLGHKFFAVQYRRPFNYECYTSSDAGQTYAKYGRTTGCKDGKGGNWMMNVYEIGKSEFFDLVSVK